MAIDDETYVGFRTKVMTYVLLDTMVRVCELVDIKRQNIDFKNLQETEEFGNEYVFLTYDGEKIGEAMVRDNLRVFGQIAKINNKRVSPHTLRHTGALFYILNGGDPFSLQRILGHSHMNMVRRYVQMTNIDVQNQHSANSPLIMFLNKKRIFEKT